jgi:peptidyl-prolyl cis-trans isomerase-like 1
MTYFQVQRSLSGSSQTCENFAQLAKRGYYNGVIFHRIVAVRLDESRLFRLLLIVSFKKDFMVQGGDPTGTGKGGTSMYGQKLYVAHHSSSATSHN